ncbi:MAG: DUF45 domain-containing protein [Lachnospiraceae bacterium]|nr:DUF45 domain-containing protein [Lachnospiraceae bacterium]
MTGHKTYTEQTKTLPLKSGKVLTYTLSRKAVRRINLRIHAKGNVSVSAPPSTPLAAIEAFLLEKEDFLTRSLTQMRQREASRKKEYDERMEAAYAYATAHKLPVKRDRKGNELIGRMGFPGSYFNGMPYVAGKGELTGIITEVEEKFLREFGPMKTPVTISMRIMRSRWGSCRPSRGSITLNGLLYYVPVACMEYVVIHEYCHLLEANHSKAFWNHVAFFLPDYKSREALLSEYEPKLMPFS